MDKKPQKTTEGLEKEKVKELEAKKKDLEKKKIALARVTLSKLQIDKEKIKTRIQDLISRGILEIDAKEIAGLEEIIRITEKRKAILIENPGIKDAEKLLKSAEKNIEISKAKIIETKTKYQSLDDIKKDNTDDKDKTKDDEEEKKELEKYVNHFSLLLETAISTYLADKPELKEFAEGKKSELFEDFKKEYKDNSNQDVDKALVLFTSTCGDKDSFIKFLEGLQGKDKDIDTSSLDKDSGKENRKTSEEIIAELEVEIEKTENLIKNTDFKDFQEKKEELEKKLNDLKEIILDRKDKPFLYYCFEKSKNPIILERKNKTINGFFDLRKIEKDWIGMDYNFLIDTGKNEGYFSCDIYGFIKIIKNVKEISGEKGIRYFSDDAIYKIVGPDGEIITDDIQGYDEMCKTYGEKRTEYEEKIKKEYEENHPTDEMMEGLNDFKKLFDKKIGIINTECEETVQRIESIKNKDEIIKEAEEKRAKEFENGPLSLRMKKVAMGSMKSWEHFGEGEKGFNGFRKRMTKTFVNIALIGSISLVSMDALVNHGLVAATASASSGGFASKMLMRMGFGLGLGGAVDAGSGVMSEKMKKIMPWAMIALSAGMATAFSGAVAVGAVAGTTAYLGSQVSKRLNLFFNDNKIKNRKEEATQKLFKKYESKNGEIDLSRMPEFEKEYRKLIIKYENQGIWGKGVDEALKILVGSAVSTVAMGASGYARDNFAHGQTTTEVVKVGDHNTHNTQTTDEIPKEQNLQNENNSIKLAHDAELKAHNDSIQTAQETETKDQQTVETSKTPVTLPSKPITVEFSSKGGIQTILDMKEEIHKQYPDISKAPTNIQEFIKTPAIQEATKIGFSDGSNGGINVQHGSTLTFDEKGLSMHDIKTDETHSLIETKGNEETIEKYNGKMIYTDNSTPKIDVYEKVAQYNPHNFIPRSEFENDEHISNLNNHSSQLGINNDLASRQTDPVINHPGGSQAEVKTAMPVEHAGDLRHLEFKDSNHVVSVKNEDGTSVNMKFYYDANGKIIGTDVGGNLHGAVSHYVNDQELHKLGSFDRLDANKDIFEMASKAQFLNTLPRNTYEYNYLHDKVLEMQENINKNYGHVINTDNQEHQIDHTKDSEQTNTDKHDLLPKEIRELHRLHNHNINHVFPNDYEENNWAHVKGANAHELFKTETSYIEKNTPELKQLSIYEHKLSEVTGLNPIEKDLLHSSETHEEFIKRAEEMAVKMGKQEEIRM